MGKSGAVKNLRSFSGSAPHAKGKCDGREAGLGGGVDPGRSSEDSEMFLFFGGAKIDSECTCAWRPRHRKTKKKNGGGGSYYKQVNPLRGFF